MYIYMFNSSYIFKIKTYLKPQSYQNIHVKLET